MWHPVQVVSFEALGLGCMIIANLCNMCMSLNHIKLIYRLFGTHG